MAERVYVHVGTPKSGTTYIQGVLAANSQALAADAGLLFPGDSWRQQVLGVRDLLRDVRPDGADLRGAWRRLVDEIDSWRGRALISMEWLAPVTVAEAQRTVDAFPGTEVRVVITARNLARVVPAAWQEFCQNQRTCTWADFLKSISGKKPVTRGPAVKFWRQQDLARIIDTWSAVVSPEAISVVTVPDSSSDTSLFWSRFCEAVDVAAPARYETLQTHVNPSLGFESSELLRRVNVLVKARGIHPDVYERVFKRGLAKQALAQRSGHERSPVVPASYHAWLRERSRTMIKDVEDRGVNVIGDLADLEAAVDDAQGVEDGVDRVTAEELLAVAVYGLVELGQRQHDEILRLEAEIRDRDQQQVQAARQVSGGLVAANR